MIEGFKNIGRAIVKVFSSMAEAAREVFDAIKPETIFNALGAFHKLTAFVIYMSQLWRARRMVNKAIVNAYVRRILRGRITTNDVPNEIRSYVNETLNKDKEENQNGD